jgi:DnaJ-domain-containing protein 1
MSKRTSSGDSGLRDLPKPLAEMTDRELEEELWRRRRLRAVAQKGTGSPITEAERKALEQLERSLGNSEPKTGVAAALERFELARHYAALELKPGATLAEVQAKYRELMAKYHPDKHLHDPEKHATAVRLVQELTRAYQILSERLTK